MQLEERSKSRVQVFCFLLCLLAASVHADPLLSMAKQLAARLETLPSRRVAVLPFQYPDGGLSSGSTLVCERLMSGMARDKDVVVIERTLLPAMMDEMKIENSGITVSSAPVWGKILAVDGIVVGTLFDLGGGRTEVHARLVQLETGIVLAARTATIKRTWADMPILPPPGLELLPASPVANVNIDTLIRDPVLPPGILSTVRRIYVESQDPRVRAGALYGMGIILERQGQLAQATQVYRQLMDEFPEDSRVKSNAEGRLWARGEKP